MAAPAATAVRARPRPSRIGHARQRPLRPGSTWRMRAMVMLLGALYVCGWSALSLLHLHTSDLERTYLPAVQMVLDGHPLLIYSATHRTADAFDNGPLGLIPLVGIMAALTHLGWQHSMALTRVVVVGVFTAFPLLLAREAVHTIDELVSTPLRGARRLLVYEVFLVSLQLYLGMSYYGHIEQPLMLWLVLAGVRMLGKRRPGLAGVLLGLSLLTRTTALVVLIPIVLVVARQRAVRSLIWLCAGIGITALGGMLPFLLADPQDVRYSLVTFHNTLPVSGNNFWLLARSTSFQGIAQHADGVLILSLATLLSLAVLYSRLAVPVVSRQTYGLLALCSLLHPLFANMLWPYYLLEAFTFLALWWLTGLGNLAEARRSIRVRWWLDGLFPFGVVGVAQVAQYALAVSMDAHVSTATTASAAWAYLTCDGLLGLTGLMAWRQLAAAERPFSRTEVLLAQRARQVRGPFVIDSGRLDARCTSQATPGASRDAVVGRASPCSSVPGACAGAGERGQRMVDMLWQDEIGELAQLTARLSCPQQVYFQEVYGRARRSPTAAFVWCLLLGCFGAHMFYLERRRSATLRLLFCWTLIPALLAFVEIWRLTRVVQAENLLLAREILAVLGADTRSERPAATSAQLPLAADLELLPAYADEAVPVQSAAFVATTPRPDTFGFAQPALVPAASLAASYALGTRRRDSAHISRYGSLPEAPDELLDQEELVTAPRMPAVTKRLVQRIIVRKMALVDGQIVAEAVAERRVALDGDEAGVQARIQAATDEARAEALQQLAGVPTEEVAEAARQALVTP